MLIIVIEFSSQNHHQTIAGFINKSIAQQIFTLFIYPATEVISLHLFKSEKNRESKKMRVLNTSVTMPVSSEELSREIFQNK